MFRLAEERWPELSRLVHRTAAAISSALGDTEATQDWPKRLADGSS